MMDTSTSQHEPQAAEPPAACSALTSADKIEYGDVSDDCRLPTQGDVISNFEIPIAVVRAGVMGVEFATMPYIIVVSQACDIDRIFNEAPPPAAESTEHRVTRTPLMISILTASIVDIFKDDLGFKGEAWNHAKKNMHPRCHLLSSVPRSCSEGESDHEEVNLMIDFRKTFTVAAQELARQLESTDAMARLECTIISPYLEDLMQRYTSYIGRVALPVSHTIQKSTSPEK